LGGRSAAGATAASGWSKHELGHLVDKGAIFGRAAISGRLALDTSPSAKPVQVYIRLAAALAAGGVLPEVTLDADASTAEAAE
jgi:hypothetical protein